MDNRIVRSGFNRQTPSAVLQMCMNLAVDESAGLISRWIAATLETLRQHESWAVSSSQKTDLSKAIQELTQYKEAFVERWVENWGSTLSEALRHPGYVGLPKRTLANINFDDLELMDDVQIQATVQVARLEQAVQGFAGDALSELTALLSRAQGFASSKPEYNPLRPDIAVLALRLTIEGVTRDKAVRTLWLQHGTATLGQELQVLYRLLIRLLETHGVKPADYQVVQTPTVPNATRAGGAGRQRPVGLADQFHDMPHEPRDGLEEAVPSALLTLDYLHDLLVTGPGEVPGHAAVLSEAPQPLPMIDIPGAKPPGIDPGLKPTAVTVPGTGRKVQPPPPAAEDPGNPLQALASEVVSLMLDGITRDSRLLQPVREMLHKLQPALLRIARDDPRFFVDKLNPARRLLDEITRRSLAFKAESSPGFGAFQATLEDLIPLLERADVRLASLFETALDVLVPTDKPGDTPSKQDKARGRAVASLVQAEQRFLLADRVARELSERRDFSMAHGMVRKFLTGPWAKVIAQARLTAQPLNNDPDKARLPADVRYLGAVSDLIWSSRVDAAGRNRSRLARLIPGLLRTLREGLQTIGYDGERARHFFGVLLQLHSEALKADLSAPVADRSAAAPDATRSGPAEGSSRPWVQSGESADSGFMDSDFQNTQPLRSHDHQLPPEMLDDDIPVLDEEVEGEPVPSLDAGAWIELCRESGEWVRLELVWTSPHGLMYLFGNHGGRTSSMSRKHFEDMFRAERIRLVAGQSVVDDALGRVLDVATRNSARTPAPLGQETHYPDLLPPLA